MASTITDRAGSSGNLAMKAPVKVATTANITLSGEQTIDTVAIVAEDRVLVKDQTTTSQNGIYICKASTWERAPDCDATGDLAEGTLVFVIRGTTNIRKLFRVSSADSSIVIGTDAIAFTAGTTLS
jgi:phage-related tail fiber protein